MKKLVMLISNSGIGTNLQAISTAILHKKLQATIATVISDTPASQGVALAQKQALPTVICETNNNLLPLLQQVSPDFTCLAGWKQTIAPEVLDAYAGTILNMHPGLIPDTLTGTVHNPDGTPALWNRGKFAHKAIQAFLAAKASYAGSSIHFLSHDFDFGPVLGRTFEKIQPDDTVETLYARLKIKENRLYVTTLEKLCNQELDVRIKN